MTGSRRLDAVLTRAKQAILDRGAGLIHQDAALRQAVRRAVHNPPKVTLPGLRNRASL